MLIFLKNFFYSLFLPYKMKKKVRKKRHKFTVQYSLLLSFQRSGLPFGVFPSNRLSLTPNEIVDVGDSCKTPESFKKSPLLGAKKHPDFQVTV